MNSEIVDKDVLCQERLRNLIKIQQEWSEQTFGPASERGPVGPLNHLAKEALEAAAEYGIGTQEDGLVEMADCLIILLDATWRAGVEFHDLVTMATIKMGENKTRRWNKTSGDEPVEHVRD